MTARKSATVIHHLLDLFLLMKKAEEREFLNE